MSFSSLSKCSPPTALWFQMYIIGFGIETTRSCIRFPFVLIYHDDHGASHQRNVVAEVETE
jgi:hypothetical protein